MTDTRKKRKTVKCKCGHKIITEFYDVSFRCGSYDVYICNMCGSYMSGYPE